MPFDPARWPDAVTVGRLVETDVPLGIHCRRCGRFRSVPAGEVGLDLATPVPALEGRFRCSRCGSTATEARPDYVRPPAGPSPTAWGPPPAE